MRNGTVEAVAHERVKRAIKVLLVDDQVSMRTGLRMLLQLEASAEVIGEAANATEAEVMARKFKPDVVIMDVEMPGCDGIAAASRCILLNPQCIVIILTIHNRPEVRERAVAAGVWAFIEKGKPQELRDAFRRAAQMLQLGPAHS